MGAGGVEKKRTKRPELCGNKATAGIHLPRTKHDFTHHAPQTGNDGSSEGLVMGDATYFRVRAGSLPGWCRPQFQPSSIGVLAALMQFVILPKVAKKLHDEDK